MEKDARRHGSKVREVSPAEAGRLLRDAIASFWKYGAAPGTDRGERYGLLCSSLAIARPCNVCSRIQMASSRGS